MPIAQSQFMTFSKWVNELAPMRKVTWLAHSTACLYSQTMKKMHRWRITSNNVYSGLS